MPERFATPRRGGYTLIELLIVVAILGLAGSLLVPNIVDHDSMRAQAAVRQLIVDLSFAQSDALAHQEFRRVHFFPDGRGYALVRVTEATYDLAFVEATADYIEDPLGTESQLGRYIVNFFTDDRYEGVSISSVDIDSGGRDIVYDALGGTIMSGGIPGIGGTIEISSGDEQYSVTVSPFTGKLTVIEL